MTGPLSIALSGLQAASTRASAAAANIANAGTSGAREGTDGPAPYTPVDVVQTSGESGTQARVVDRNPATEAAYDPAASYADEQGYVAAPNVDMAEEIINLKAASQAYAANAAVARVASDMEREMIDRFDETV
jgi:flagellar basal-body rod protein FlgC